MPPHSVVMTVDGSPTARVFWKGKALIRNRHLPRLWCYFDSLFRDHLSTVSHSDPAVLIDGDLLVPFGGDW